MRHDNQVFFWLSGAPDRTRTYNPQLRRLMLYPVELRAQEIIDCIIASEKLNQSLFKQIVLLSSLHPDHQNLPILGYPASQILVSQIQLANRLV